LSFLFAAASLSAANITSATTGNWNVATTWSPQVIPTSADAVTIIGGTAVTIPNGYAASAASLVMSGDVANPTTLVINNSGSGASLTVTGSVSLTAPGVSVVNQIDVGAGSLTAGSLSINGGTNSGAISRVTVSTGSVDLTGDLGFVGSSVQTEFKFSSNGTLNVGGDIASGGTFVASSSTVTFVGSTAQSIGAYTYANLTIDKSGGTATIAGATTVSGVLNVASGTLDTSTYTLSAADYVNVDGSITGTGALQLTGIGGKTLSGGASGGIGAPVSVNANTTFNTTSGFSIGSDLTIGGGIEVTNDGAIAVYKILGTNALSKWINAANSTLTYVHDYIFSTDGVTYTGTLDASASGNTVTYSNNGPNTLFSTTYHNLYLSTSGTKTANAGLTIDGHFGIGSNVTFAAGSYSHSVAGNFTNNGTLSYTGTFTLGGANTTLDGSGGTVGSGTFKLSGTTKTIDATASLSVTGPVAVDSTTTVTNNGTFTSSDSTSGINGLGGSSAWIQGTNSTLNVQGPLMTTGALTASASGNTVNYNGGNQSIKAITYHHLSLSNSGTKSFAGATTLNGNFQTNGSITTTLPSTFTVGGNFATAGTSSVNLGSGTVSVAGSFTASSGSVAGGTSTIDFNGTSAQSIDRGTGSFNNVTFTNGGAKNISSGLYVFGNVTINSGATVNLGSALFHQITGNWTNNGTLNAGTATIEFTGAQNNTISGSGSGSFYVLKVNKAAVATSTTLGASVTTSSSCGSFSGTLALSTFNLTCGGDLLGSGTVNTGTGTLTINGNNSSFTGTLTPANITFAGSGSSNVLGTTYNNLTINKTSGSVVATLTAATTVTGALSVQGGTLYDAGFAITGSGSPSLTVSSGSTLKLGSSSIATSFPAGFATPTLGSTSIVDYASGVAQTISTSPTYGELRVEASGVVTKTLDAGTTLNAASLNVIAPATFSVSGKTLVVSGGFSGNGPISFGTGSGSFALGGSWTNTSSFTAGSSTVTYNGASPSVQGVTYNNLVIAVSGTATANLTVTVNGDLTVSSGTFSLGSSGLSVSGTFTNGATFNAGTGTTVFLFGDAANNGTFNGQTATVRLNGSALQTWSGSSAPSFSGLQINNAAGATFNAGASVSGSMSLSGGNVVIGSSQTLAIGSSGALVRNNSSYILGKLLIALPASTTKTFHVGTTTGYAPVAVTSASAVNFAVTANSGAEPNATGTNLLSRYWTLSAAASGTYGLAFTYNAGDVTGTESSYTAGYYSGGWTRPSTTINTTTHSATVAGISNPSGNWTVGEPASLGASAVTYTAVANGNWSSSSTWSPTGVPGSIDTATVNGFAVTVDTNTTVATVNLSSGSIDGTNTLTVTSGFNWTGGTLSGVTGILSLANSSGNTISGSGSKTLNRVVNNAGTLTWSGSGSVSHVGGLFTNSGSFNVQTSGNWIQASTGSFTNSNVFGRSAGGTTTTFGVTFTNSGSMSLNDNTTLVFSGTFDNSGTVNLVNGDQNLTGGGTSSGAWVIGSGRAVNIPSGNYTFNTGSSFTGAGNLVVNGGTLQIAGTASGDNLDVTSGTVSGSGTLSVASLDWSGGTLTGSSGVLNLTFGGVSTISGSGSKTLNRIVNNHGAVTWSGSGSVSHFAGAFTNYGTFNHQSDGNWIQASTGSFVNSGTWNRNAGTNSTVIGVSFTNNTGATATFSASGMVTLSGTVDNDGGVNVTGGDVVLSGAGTTNGTWAISSAKTVSFTAGSSNFNNGSSFSGAGTLAVAGGTLLINGNVSGANLDVTSGTLDGTGTLTINTSFDWTGGLLTGASGSLALATGSTNTISGPNPKTLNRIVNNNGTLTWSGNGSVSHVAGLFTNNGTFYQQADGNWIQSSSGSFTNNSTYTRNDGTTDVTVGVPFTNSSGATANFGNCSCFPGSGFLTFSGAFNNDGTINQTGQKTILSGGGSSAGTWSIASGDLVDMTAGTFTFSNGSSVSGSGKLLVEGATLTVGGGVSINNFQLDSGTVNGNGTLTVGGELDWTGGTFSDPTGSVILSGAGNHFISGNNSKVLNRFFLNNSVLYFSGAGSLSHISGTFNNANAFHYEGSGSWIQSSSGSFLNSGTLTREISSSTVTMGVPVDNSNGTIDVKSGILNLTGSYTQNSASHLKFAIGGGSPGAYGQINVSGAVNYNGAALTAYVINAYSIAGGQQFNVLTCNTCSGTIGTKNLTFGNARSFSDSLTSSALVLTASGPTITGVSPNSGTTAGGTSVIITGTGFQSGGSFGVKFGGTSATCSTGTMTATSVTCTTPGHAAGAVDVVLTNGDVDATTTTSTNGYTYVVGCVAAPANIVGWWRAEGNAADSVGTNNGTLASGATTAAGKVGQAFTFDGVNDSMNVPMSTSLQLSSAVTIEFWMKGDPSNNLATCCQGLVTTDMYGIEIAGSGVHFGVSTDNGATTPFPSSGQVSISTNQWHHIAGTYDGSTIALYVDGVLAASSSHSGALSSNSGFLSIGSEDGRTGACPSCVGTRYFKGLLDEVGIYGRALSSSEIQSLYDAGTAGKCYTASAPAISNFSPGSGQAGSAVVITGTDLIGASSVTFNGTAATFTVNSATQITAVVPSGATTGPIAVTTDAGTATSSANFTPIVVIHWTNAAGGNWSTPSNWSGGVVPTSADNVAIDTAGTYTVTVDVAAGSAALTIGGGSSGTQTLSVVNTLTTSANSSVVTNGVLAMNGGTLAGAGNMTIATGSMTWSGGTISNAGLINTTGRTVTGTSAYLIVNATTFTNNGTLNLGSSANLRIQNGATLANSGIVDLQADNTIDQANGGSLTGSGTIRKTTSAGTALLSIGLSLQSGAQIQAQNGTLLLNASSTVAGTTLTASSGATLRFNSTLSLDSASAITGAGTADFTGGAVTNNGAYSVTGTTSCSAGGHDLLNVTSAGSTVNVAGGILNLYNASPISIASLNLSGGTLGGSGTINVTGTTQSWSGGTINGGGTVNISSSTTANIANSYVIFDGRTFVNNGTINLTNTNANLRLQNSAALTNNNIIDIKADNTIDQATGGTLINAATGIIRKTTTAGTALLSPNLTLQSGSQLQAQNGILSLNGGTSAATGASLTVSSGATLRFGGTTINLDSASTISGAGTVEFTGGGVTHHGSYNVTGATTCTAGGHDLLSVAGVGPTLTVSGGILNLYNTSPLGVTTLALSGGTLGGSGDINVTGSTQSWSGATVNGSGTINISSSTTANIANSYVVFDGRALLNDGTINLSNANANLRLQNGAALTNNGTIDFKADNTLDQAGSGGSLINRPTGIIRKTTSAGTSLLAANLTLQSGSQLQAQSGIFSLGNGTATATGASLAVSSGATLRFGGTTITLDTASTVSGAGNVDFVAGGVTHNGSYNVTGATSCSAGGHDLLSVASVGSTLGISGGILNLYHVSPISVGTLHLSGGTLGGSGTVNVTGTSTWSGATVNGGGTISLSGSAITNIANSYVVFDGRALTNAGTLNLSNANANLRLQNGAVLTNNGIVDFQADNTIDQAGTGGSVTNNGTIRKTLTTGNGSLTANVTNASGGVIEIDLGTLNVSGGSLANSGTLYFPIASDTAFGKMNVSGTFNRSGTLKAKPLGTYVPPANQSYQILSYGAISGAFASTSLTFGSRSFTDNYTATTGTLTADLATCTSLPSGVISWYRAEGNGADSIGSNAATLSGSPSTVTGYVGQALSFNGSNYMSAADSASLRPASVSLEAWVNFTSLPAIGTIVSKTVGTGNLNSYSLWYQGGALNGIAGGSGAAVSYSWAPLTGTWHHVAYTFDSSGGAQALYIDGAQVAGGTNAVSISYDSHPLMIGAEVENESVQFGFPGVIDELALYSRALTAAEVQNIYYASASGKCVPAATDLTVTPTVAPSSVAAGGALAFTTTITSVAAGSATNVTLTQSLPSNVALNGTPTSTQGSCSGTTVITCTIGTIAPGATITVTINTTASTAGTATSAASVSLTETDSTPANNNASVSATITGSSLTVTNNANSGTGSLRQAITDANNASLCTLPCSIGFNLPGGQTTISVPSALPQIIRNQVIVNGTTQPGYAGVPLVTIDGLADTSSAAGFDLQGTGDSVRGLALIRFHNAAILLAGGGSHTVESSYIGLTTAGVAAGNNEGIRVTSPSNTIGGANGITQHNVISGNTGAGVEIVGGIAGFNNVQNNYIGTGTNGTTARANGVDGIQVLNGASNTTITGNVIAGNTNSGIYIAGTGVSTGNVITANYIGLDSTGNVPLANGSAGIYFGNNVTNTTIGGATIAARNLIGGNSQYGIVMLSACSGNLVQGNSIGVGRTGPSVPNGVGISLQSGASNNKVDNNVIANNSGIGVRIDGGANGNVVLNNQIHDNGALGIDIDGDGVTANDSGDSDAGGGNNRQNFPLLIDALLSGSNVNVHFNADSSAIPTTGSLQVELFTADSSGAEGSARIATQCFAGNTLSNQLISAAAGTIAVGDKIVATATSYTDGACATPNDGTSEFSASVTVTCAPPSATIIAPASVCAGATSSASVAATSGATYFWSITNGTINGANVASSISFTAGSSGNVGLSVVVTANTCSSNGSASVSIGTFTPSITASGPTTFCAGGSVTLTATAGASYLWSTGQTTQSITVTAGGNYSVTVTNGAGCSGTSAATTVTVNPAPATPVITANGPTTFCSGGSVILDAGAGYASYNWSNGATTQTITVTASGSFSVTVSNGSCSASSSAMNVTVNTPPPATITAPASVCAGATSSASVTVTSGATYAWSISNGTINGASNGSSISFTANPSGSVGLSVTVTANGCAASGSATVAIGNFTPAITASGPTTFCTGGSVTLTATAGTSYLWSTGATTQSINVASAGTYSVTVTNGSGCSGSASTNVTVNSAPAPAITANGPTTFCAGGSVTLDAGAGFSSYLWSNGATTQAITVSNSGSFSVTVTNGAGCSGTSSPTNVTVSSALAPSITANGPTTFCTGGNVTLDAGAGFASYLWSNGATTQTITISNSGSFSVTVTNGAGCSGTSSPTNVTVSSAPTPSITANGPTTFCPGGSVTLDAGAGFASYHWSNGAPTQTITVSNSGSFSVTVTNGAGCSGTSAATNVTVASAGSATITAPQSVVAGSSGNSASVAAGPAGSSYSWSISGGSITSGQGTPSITWSAGNIGPIAISVTINSSGCTATGSASVGISGQSDLGVSIAASPNPVNAGGAIVFTVTPSNAGPSNAANVVVSASLPAGYTINSAGGSGWSCSSSTSSTICSAANVPVGGLAAITINATAPSTAGSANATATIGSGTSDPNSANDSASVVITVQQPTVNCPGTAPSLVAPANGATVSNPVSFSWSAVTGATSYEVWVTGTNAAATMVASTTGATTASASLSSGDATWSVIARFGTNCPALTSSQRSFTVAQSNSCDNHGAPILTSPAPNATVTSPVTLQWQAVGQAIGYHVFVAIDGGAQQDIGSTTGATQLTSDLTGGSVEWSVDALFAGCAPTHSATAKFTIPKADPCAGRAAPQLTAPANNSVGGSIVDFKWNSVANADGYRLFASFNGGEFTALGTTTGTTLHKTLSAGGVEWYVESLFDGCAAQQSAHSTFTVPAAVSCNNTAATPLAPSNDATLTVSPVNFSWAATPGAIGYEVWLSLNNATPAVLGTSDSTSLTASVPAGSLDWYVRALFNGCAPVDSAISHFTYAPPPACPTQHPLLTAPLDNSTLSGNVDFHWSAVSGATQYRVWISLNDGAPTLLGTINATQLIGQVVPISNISWYVEVMFGGNCPPQQSTAGTFKTVAPPPPCTPPGVPTPIAPSEISSNVDYNIIWAPTGGALYEVEESASPDFTTFSTLTTAATQAGFKHVNNGATGVTFYYRVRAIGSCTGQQSLFSPAISVNIVPPAASNTGSTPADNKQDVVSTIQLGNGGLGSAGDSFTATPTETWIEVTPASGTIAPAGTMLTVTSHTAGLPLGTSTGGVIVTINGVVANGNKHVTDNKTTTTTVSVNVAQPVSSNPKNTPPPDALIIPAVAHADGINSSFESDVRVTNSGATLQKYQLTFTPSGDSGITQGKQTTLDVEPGRTVALDDVLKTWFGAGSSATGATGTLEVRPLNTTSSSVSAAQALGSLPNFVTFAASRTFNTTANGTFGQFIPGIPYANFIGKSATTLSLQQIAQSAKFRTNLGIVEGSGDPAQVLISVFGDNGGKLTEFTHDLKGGQHVQLNGILATKGLTNVSDGRVEVKVVSATGKVTAYASVIDNATNDPLLVSPVSVNQSLAASKYVIPGVANLDTGFANWQTDVRLFNASSTPVKATLTFVSQGDDAPLVRELTINGGEVKTLDSTLTQFFGITGNAGGALHIATSTAVPLVATARTYNLTAAGTYGQFIPAVTPNDAASRGSRALQLLQIEESNRYRTNLGLAEVTGKAARIEISVVPADSRVAARNTIDLKPNQFVQYSQILRSMGFQNVFNARMTVRVIEGDGRVAAYASVIDAQTNDPTYVPAQ
jgi:hypothetical protein